MERIMNDVQKKIIAIAKEKGIVRAKDLIAIGIQRTALAYLAKKGVFRKVARGAYILEDQIFSVETFISALAAVPHGVICLLSALQYHEITTQMPMETWVAIERDKTVPQAKPPSIRIVKMSGSTFSEGIEIQTTDKINIRIYSPAKTIADCFKFRNKIGLDIAREALIDCLEQQKATRDEIYHHAKLCRVARVIRPYLEMT